MYQLIYTGTTKNQGDFRFFQKKQVGELVDGHGSQPRRRRSVFMAKGTTRRRSGAEHRVLPGGGGNFVVRNSVGRKRKTGAGSLSTNRPRIFFLLSDDG
jgi:hypothetical protein